MVDRISTSLNGGGISGQPSSFTSGPSYQDGVNLGNGIAVFSGLLQTGKFPTLGFHTLGAGNGISLALTTDGNTIVISANTQSQNLTFFSPNDLAISQTNSVVVFSLNNTAVVAGTYSNPTIVVDSKGRVLSAANGVVANSANSIGIVSPDLNIANTPVQGTGTFVVSLTNTGVTAGTYTFATVSVDAKGRVHSIASGDLANAGLPNGTVTSVAAFGSDSISVDGSPVTRAGSFLFDLTNTGVVAGTYSLSTIVVDAQGRVSSAANGVATDLGVTLVSLTGSNAIAVGGAPITATGTFSVDLTDTGVTPGTYASPSVGVDGKGRIVSIQQSPSVTTFTVNNNDLTLNGSNVVGAGTSLTATGAVAISLTNTGVTAGTYTSADIVVDNKGRIRTIQNGGAGGTVKNVGLVIQGNGLHVSGSPIATSGTFTLSLLETGVTTGTYSKVSVDNLGRVLAGQALANTDIMAALGYTPAKTDSEIFTGNVRGVTAAHNDNSTSFATTAFVQRELANAVAYLLAAIANSV